MFMVRTDAHQGLGYARQPLGTQPLTVMGACLQTSVEPVHRSALNGGIASTHRPNNP